MLRDRRSILLCAALPLLGLVAQAARAQDPVVARTPREVFESAGANDLDVVVASVVTVAPGPATNGNPPRVEIDEIEILQGRAGVDRMAARWLPYRPFGIIRCGNDTRIKAWSQTPIHDAPTKGEKLILVGQLAEGRGGHTFDVVYGGRFAFSAELREQARAWIALGAAPRLAAAAAAAREVARLETERLAWWDVRRQDAAPDALLADADFVAVACGFATVAPGTTAWRIEEVLRGPRLVETTPYVAHAPLPGGVESRLAQADRYVLLLRATHIDVVAGQPVARYTVAPGSVGILRASDELVGAVRAALAQREEVGHDHAVLRRVHARTAAIEAVRTLAPIAAGSIAATSRSEVANEIAVQLAGIGAAEARVASEPVAERELVRAQDDLRTAALRTHLHVARLAAMAAAGGTVRMVELDERPLWGEVALEHLTLALVRGCPEQAAREAMARDPLLAAAQADPRWARAQDPTARDALLAELSLAWPALVHSGELEQALAPCDPKLRISMEQECTWLEAPLAAATATLARLPTADRDRLLALRGLRMRLFHGHLELARRFVLRNLGVVQRQKRVADEPTSGDRDRWRSAAFSHLEAAIGLNPATPEQLAHDDELRPLIDDPRWAALGTSR